MFDPELKRGSLDLLILSALQGQPKHGYEIGKLLASRSDGKLDFPVSTLYSILYRMENRGWIAGRWVEKTGVRRRCYYTLTSEGETVLKAKQEQWREYTATVNKVIEVGHA